MGKTDEAAATQVSVTVLDQDSNVVFATVDVPAGHKLVQAVLSDDRTEVVEVITEPVEEVE